MAQPGRVYDDDTNEQPVTGPNLRALEGGGETSAPRSGHLSSVAGDEGSGGAPSLFNASGDKAVSPSTLGSMETAGSLFNAAGSPGIGGKLKVGLSILKNRKTLVGGGGGVLIALAVAFFVISSGPLEFVHFAQLLQRFHFSSMENTQDRRLTKLARFIREPGKAERTRMGVLGNAVADKLETRMNKSGFESKYSNGVRYFEGYTINPENEHFKDKTPAEMTDQLVNQHGIDPQHIHETVYNGKPTIEIDASQMGYREKSQLTRNVLENTHMQKITSTVGARIMGTRGLVDWHPVKKLDQKLLQQLADSAHASAAKQKLDDLKKQWRAGQLAYAARGVGATPTPAEEQQAAQEENGGTDPVAEKNVADIKDKLKAGGTNAATFICTLKGVNDSVPKIRFAIDVVPMLRMGMQVITLGNQVMSNQDISAVQAGFGKEHLDKVDKKGNAISTWTGARSIQAELGQKQTGPDIPKAGKSVGKGVPLPFLDNPILDPVCGFLSSLPGQIITSIGGGPIASVVNFVSGNLLSDAAAPLLDSAAGLLAGGGVDALASGADFGNYANYGARIAANDQAAAAGGVALTNTQESQLKTADAAVNKDSFQSHSIAYRLFNPNDSSTLVSHIIDEQNPNVTQNIAHMATSLTGIFSSALKIPATLLSSNANAASTNASYDYGFQKYGFPPNEEDSQIVKDPFDNARKVVPILDADWADPGPPPHPLITRLKECFGVDVSPNGNTWDVQGGNSVTNLYDGYDQAKCADKSETWTRLRYFILDTEAMKSNACYFGDEQSCTDIGFGSSSSSSSSSTSTSSGTLPTGSAKDLATQLKPYVASGKIKCIASGCPDIVDTANGQSIKGGTCLVDSLQPGLVGMLLELVKMGHTFLLSALCSDHGSVTPLAEHSGGRAADFNYIDGVFMGPNDVPWDSQKIAVGKKLDQDVASFMPKSTQFGQIQCHPTFDFLSGFTTYNDTCHHQHIAVEN